MSLVVFIDGRPTPFRTTAATHTGVEPVEPVSPVTRRAYNTGDEYSRPKQRRPALRVADIMTTPIVTVAHDVLLEKARELMDSRRIRHLPVTRASSDGERPGLVGMISDRDLLRDRSASPSTLASEIMTTSVLTAEPDTPLNEAAAVMLERRIHSLPVLIGSQPTGIVTTTDILRALVHRAPLDLWV